MGKYKLSEIVDTYQAEGAMSGWPVRLLRFAGCNLACPFCDEHLARPRYILDADEFAERLPRKYPAVMLTGGEPLLHMDIELAKVLAAWRNETFGMFMLETNGAVRGVLGHFKGIAHVVCSPKHDSDVVLGCGDIDELKYVVPGCWPGNDAVVDSILSILPNADAKSAVLKRVMTKTICIQPEWRDDGIKSSLPMALRCSQHIQMALGFMPRLSIQWHKFVNMP